MNKTIKRKWVQAAVAVMCVLGMTCGFTSCEEELDPWVPVELEAECQQEEAMPYNGGTFSINVNSNTAWTVTASDWITVDRTSGTGQGTINVTVEENTGDNRRSGSIRITAGGSEPDGDIAGQTSQSFNITQEYMVDAVEITDVLPTISREPSSTTRDGYHYYGSVTYTVNTTLTDEEISNFFTNSKLLLFLYARRGDGYSSGGYAIESIPLTNGIHTIDVDFDMPYYYDPFRMLDVYIRADYKGSMENLFFTINQPYSINY